jgi:hypothetical protein
MVVWGTMAHGGEISACFDCALGLGNFLPFPTIDSFVLVGAYVAHQHKFCAAIYVQMVCRTPFK